MTICKCQVHISKVLRCAAISADSAQSTPLKRSEGVIQVQVGQQVNEQVCTVDLFDPVQVDEVFEVLEVHATFGCSAN